MTITDRRFGGEVVTEKGKVFKFDTLECMHAHLEKNQDHTAKIYVVDSTQNGVLVKSEEAVFKIFPEMRSPMGKGIIAVQNRDSFQRAFASGSIPSKEYRWSDLQQELTPGEKAQ